MTDPITFGRRRFLATGLAGCSLAASPLVTPLALASAPGDARLVVILLRGGMDGLDVVRPVFDPDFAGLRPGLAGESGLPLAQGFALHPELAPLMPLWSEGSLGAVHAVSTPYRDRRSHFEGQDLLEAGLPATGDSPPESGWLNRLVARIPGATMRTAFSVDREGALILQGDAPATQWYPQVVPAVSAQAERLLTWVYEPDPLFQDAAEQAFALVEAQDPDLLEAGLAGHLRVADYVAQQLLGETRIAAFSINGWDTHGRQARTLRRPLRHLSDTLLHLRSELGPAWDRTAILALTEFGRTARENGTGGTDHGTGGAMLFAGGAVRGGRVLGDWPGLAEAALYDRRDLMPTADVRAHAAGVLAALFGTSTPVLEQEVFPGLDMADLPPIVL